ncbi:hypothetical protein F0562_018521 [Nyssa sinensis]|uniref:Uncharacterized protein n=1 Tax=Nyssa sinensis TaxID=561372 RepID=A0A5J4ZBK2_9ASTE|nr:hypothetical protein F0562_018521 [Nyssa sinensis]
MARATARIPVSHRILTFDNCEIECSGKPAMSLSDTVFEFLDTESECSPKNIMIELEGNDGNEGAVEENGGSGNVEDNKSFWETQHQLLDATLCRTSSLESRIRNITKEAVKETQTGGNACGCRRPVPGACRNCLMRETCHRLQNASFNSAICTSKWKSSPNIPSGEHTFLDVVDKLSSKKGEEVRVIIELNFRAEFEMARASFEYKQLISKLPEVFVGKIERLHALIKILCSAAKKCMKENKMHMGPWRKYRYMQSKWQSPCERTTSMPSLSTGYPNRPPRPRASMLTVDLQENFPNLHHTAVEVV